MGEKLLKVFSLNGTLKKIYEELYEKIKERFGDTSPLQEDELEDSDKQFLMLLLDDFDRILEEFFIENETTIEKLAEILIAEARRKELDNLNMVRDVILTAIIEGPEIPYSVSQKIKEHQKKLIESHAKNPNRLKDAGIPDKGTGYDKGRDLKR